MALIFVAIILILLGGFSALIVRRSPKCAAVGAAAGIVSGSIIGLVQSFISLFSEGVASFSAAWSIPYGSFSIAIDPLSAFFLIPIFILAALSSIYGSEYLLKHYGQRSTGNTWFFLSLLIVSMVVVVIAQNGILFLIAWEMMAISSFFLVTFDDEKKSVRSAGWTYLVATHIGTAFLLLFFVMAGTKAGTFDFSGWGAIAAFAPSSLTLLFILALIGFGTKAGIVPLHVWLPEAHPAAPSHVSAIMSGVMIKTGIYGLLRMMTFLGLPHLGWGYLFVFIGLTSGILGVVYALAQHNLKSLLAYHSVENIGIIFLGLGLGIIGLASGSNLVAILGFGGGLLHVLNHALFKGLLFFGAGSAICSTGSASIDQMGGLLKKMPVTGATFLTGSVAISGLPPLNGFVSEFMIYLGSFAYLCGWGVAVKAGMWESAVVVLIIAGLALIGGLASACFTKAFGIVFLGEPRSIGARGAKEAGLMMKIPMILLSVACAVIGLGGPLILYIIVRPVVIATGYEIELVKGGLEFAESPLTIITISAAALIFITVSILLLRGLLLKGREVAVAPTWDCGYALPSPKMQYTAASFASILVGLFTPLVVMKRSIVRLISIFPEKSAYEDHPVDIFREKMFAPLFIAVNKSLSAFKWLQHGNIHLYILYIAITLLVLLVWKLGGL